MYPIQVLCDVLEVSRSGYYGWLGRPISKREQHRGELKEKILGIPTRVKRRYGSPRIYQELRSMGEPCSENLVAKLMKDLGIMAVSTKKFRVQTTDSNHDFPIAPNELNREFKAERMNQIWLADITYIPTDAGTLYLAAVEDLYSRRVIGWSMDTKMESRLVVDAMDIAIQNRLPEEGIMAHSDRGSQYASEHYQRLLSKHGITCSMSRVGNCYDNAPMESFFATLKKELVYQEIYETIAQARLSIFEYIEVFYNRIRRHSSIGYQNPVEFECNKDS